MGITLFVMLSGEAPFQQSGSVERLLSTVCTASIDTGGKAWQAVSAEAISLLTALLKKDPRARMDLDGVRASPWLAPTMADLEREIEREVQREMQRGIAPSPPPPADMEEELALREEEVRVSLTLTHNPNPNPNRNRNPIPNPNQELAMAMAISSSLAEGGEARGSPEVITEPTAVAAAPVAAVDLKP